MPYGMYISAEGAQAQIARMETISNNLANVNTPGFKQDFLSFQARFAEAVEQGLVPPGGGPVENIGGGITPAETVTNFAPGTLQETGRREDLAINGRGFFQVRHEGEVLLTRAGNFSLDAGGKLITQTGDEVLSANGEPIIVAPEAEQGPWNVTPDGAIVQGDTRQPLALVAPRSLGDLSKVGDNLFSPLAATDPVPPGERNVLTGFLEGSGVNPTSTMMELIETSRAIGANMQLIQHQDHVIGQLISRVLQS